MNRLFRKIRSSAGTFQDRYTREDHTSVTLYGTSFEKFPDYFPTRTLDKGRGGTGIVGVSLIAVAKNEAVSASQWVESILSGNRLPDEIIVVDSGSTDGTANLLEGLASKSPVPFHVIMSNGINIAQGRNLAISKTRFTIVAVTDLGSRPEPGWLENLIYPFEDNPDMEVSAGIYRAIDANWQPIQRRGWLDLEQIDPQGYVPASISIAFKKAAWEAIGGYPEWLTLTGEDTYFALELKRVTRHWAFVPEAVVGWQAPVDLVAYWKKQYLWSVGNGEVGLNGTYYRKTLLQLGVTLLAVALILFSTGLGWIVGSTALIASGLLIAFFAGIVGVLSVRNRKYQLDELRWETGAKVAQLLGFLKGARNRKEVDWRRQEMVKGLFFILSGVPIEDTGGGARGAQVAQELLRRQFQVVFLNKFPRFESTSLDLKIRHPNLLAASLKDFSLDRFIQENNPELFKKPCGVLVEIPAAEFIPLVQGLRSKGVKVIYDLIDDWDTALGGSWYSPENEKRLIDNAHVLAATAPILAQRLEASHDQIPILLPNAVNLRLFNPERAYPRPFDLPAGERIIMYIGSLWGEWFDWELLVEIARSYPSAAVVVIGDYRDQCPQPMPNLHFLGLKPQVALPAYLAHADVAVIPWKASAITEATSPLKLFEYLAMRKPIVAPNLPVLVGIPFTLLSNDKVEFLSNIEIAYGLQVGGQAWDNFLRQNSWQARVDRLIEIVQSSQAAG